MPGYKDEFYIKENIIGYTGNLMHNPTVYFRNGDYFGRITQYHSDSTNIGRNKVRKYTDYSINNFGLDGTAMEYYDGAYRHTSRNQFVDVTHENLAILEIAINKFRKKKTNKSS